MPDRGDLDDDLRLALPTQPLSGDPVGRGRAFAMELRDEKEFAAAALIDELCDDVEGVRRQVARLGLDLHDEGLQDVTALRNDLQLFRSQVSRALHESDDRSKVVGRVDDFLARVASLDQVLRGVATSADASSVLRHPLSVTLEALIDAFPGPCVIESTLDPALDSYELTDSQRIALVRIVQSALANVLQHSEATLVSVTVRCLPTGTVTEIVDNGKGFEVESAMRQATADRRLGLFGMRERVRLLGGAFDVSSRLGGPTRIVFRLPRQPTS
jgi:signal transduction histidine kinase